MILAVDVGNTNISVGLVRDGDVASSRRTATPPMASVEELEFVLADLLEQAGAALADLTDIVMASVVPAVSDAIRELAASRKINLLVADSANVPIEIRVDEPAAVGDDRLVNALAAERLYGTPAIVVDMGTATTFDVVGADGAFIGGAIAPGAGLAVDALSSHTAQLPRVPLVMPPKAIGTNTVAAMQSGAVIGYLGLVRELVAAITRELQVGGGPTPKVILTGGLSNTDWAKAIPGIDAIDPLLTLRGLAILHSEVPSRQSVGSA